MAVGNGEMWVVDDPQRADDDIRAGDYLISSGTPGCAMKDDAQRFDVGHIVARAAENVAWAGVDAVEGGRKRAQISVLFDTFDRHDQQRELGELRAEVAALRRLVKSALPAPQ